MAIFGVGGQFLFHDNDYVWHVYNGGHDQILERNELLKNGVALGLTTLFIGKSGFTVSAGIDIVFNIDMGLNIDPVIGLGYVYKRQFYIGGILNIILVQYHKWEEEIHYDATWASRTRYTSHLESYGDGFLTPTFIAGYDFGAFVLGVQISYMYGVYSNISGFKFSLGAGVSIR
jgi:hypothetical protein